MHPLLVQSEGTFSQFSCTHISNGRAPVLYLGLCGRCIHYSSMVHLFLSSTVQGPPPPWRIQFSQPEAATHSPHSHHNACFQPEKKLFTTSPGHKNRLELALLLQASRSSQRCVLSLEAFCCVDSLLQGPPEARGP